jgi:hypothetical protein
VLLLIQHLPRQRQLAPKDRSSRSVWVSILRREELLHFVHRPDLVARDLDDHEIARPVDAEIVGIEQKIVRVVPSDDLVLVSTCLTLALQL